MAKSSLNWIKKCQHCKKIWSNLIKTGQYKSKLVKLVQTGQTWLKLDGTGQNWLKLAKICKTGLNL